MGRIAWKARQRRESTRHIGRQDRARSRSRRLRFEPLEDRHLLAVYPVTNLTDAAPGSLRDAVNQANATPGVPDTILVLPALNGTILLSSEINITDDVVIFGNGQIALDGQFQTRSFLITSGSFNFDINVTIRGLTLQNGDAASAGTNEGGAIYSNHVNLTIDHVTFSGNRADGGGAIWVAENKFVPTTTVKILDSLFMNNTAAVTGGAISSLTIDRLEIERTRFINNTAGWGGALHNNSSVFVRESEFASNTAQNDGGAIYYDALFVGTPGRLVNNTFSDNTAVVAGGAIAWRDPGAVGTATLINNTIVHNTASVGGGLSHPTSTNGAPVLYNNIIALNTATGGSSADLSGGYSPGSSDNLIGTVAGSTGIGSNNLLGVNPTIDPLLALNGGSTRTHKLLTGSPAINAGNFLIAAPLAIDQRGFVRIAGGNVDIGAYEVTGEDGAVLGQKWHDINGNGVRDPLEPGLDGWTFEVVNSLGNVVASGVTQSADLDGGGINPLTEQGLFWIYGVPAGTYQLREVGQPGWTPTFPTNGSGEHTITITAGMALQGVSFGNFQPASIRGQKWDDLNDDGVKDPNEYGLDGWTITAVDQGGSGQQFTQVTSEIDLDGNNIIDPRTEKGLYRFDNLPPGTYFVSETPQPGWHQSYPFAAGYFITVTSGEVVENFSFGNNRDTGSIHGFKYLELEVNGVYDPGFDQPLGGIKISLFGDTDGDGDNELIVTRTDSNGRFAFLDLFPGTYTVSENPGGYLPTTPTSRTLTVPGDVELVAFPGQAVLRPDQTEIVVGQQLMFGNKPPSSIHGFKYEDVDGDGVYDPGSDLPWEDVCFALWGDTDGDGDSELLTARTDANGFFAFTGLSAGPYTVSEVPPNGSAPTTPSSVTVTPGVGEELVAFAGQATLLPGQTEVVVGATLMFGNVRNGGTILGQKIAVVRQHWHSPAGTGGLQDNYATGNTETTNPSAGLLQNAINLGVPVAGYDSNLANRYFIDSFHNLPTGIVSAKVRIGLRSNGAGSANDTMALSVFNSSGGLDDPAHQFSTALSALPGGPIKTINIPATMLQFLDGGHLDVSLQDDTSVDFIELCIEYDAQVPYNGWTVDLVDSSGMVVATQQTSSIDLDQNGSIDPVTEVGVYRFQNVSPGVYQIRERSGGAVWQVMSPAGGQHFVSLHAGEVIDELDFVNRYRLRWWDSCWRFTLLDPFLSNQNLIDSFTDDFVNSGPLSGVITFDGLSGEIPADQYLLSDGVLFENLGTGLGVLPEGGPVVEDLDGYDGSYNANGNAVFAKHPNHLEPFTIVFTEPVSKVGSFLATGAEGTDHTLTVSLYGTDGNLLDTRDVEVLPFANSDNLEFFWGVEVDGDLIARVTIQNNNTVDFGNAFVTDNIYYAREGPALLGDYDRDSDVDQGDNSYWKEHYGATSGPGLTADGNGDGLVEAADYVVWRKFAGTFPGGGPGATIAGPTASNPGQRTNDATAVIVDTAFAATSADDERQGTEKVNAGTVISPTAIFPSARTYSPPRRALSQRVSAPALFNAAKLALVAAQPRSDSVESAVSPSTKERADQTGQADGWSAARAHDLAIETCFAPFGT